MCFKIFQKSPIQTDYEPSPVPVGMIPNELASSRLLDKLEELGDSSAEIYLPDVGLKVYSKDWVKDNHDLEEVSKIVYTPEQHDCDDFARELFGKFACLVWTNLHALNWFIDDSVEHIFWYIEPQTKKLSQTLEGWQGNDIRFFLGA